MLKCKFLVTFAALMFLVTGVNYVSAQTAQEGLSMGPSARPFNANDDDVVGSDFYEYDAQLWAPYDVTSTDGSIANHSGFYAELGFAYFHLTGPGAIPGQDPRGFESADEWSWANQFEVGFRGSKGTGWGLAYTGVEANTFLRDSQFSFNSPFGGFTNPTLLRTSFDDVAFNRQFRQRLSTGGHVEPYIGLRYISLGDETNQDFGLATRFSQSATNSAFGGHVGSKYFRNYGRFMIGGEMGLGALYNQQRYSATSITGVAPAGAGVSFSNSDNGFVPLLDLGVQLNYALSRDVSVRFGAELHYAWDGINRVDTRTLTVNPYSTSNALLVPSSIETQDFIATGLSLGIDWKR